MNSEFFRNSGKARFLYEAIAKPAAERSFVPQDDNTTF
jgi:hypothetical protein